MSSDKLAEQIADEAVDVTPEPTADWSDIYGVAERVLRDVQARLDAAEKTKADVVEVLEECAKVWERCYDIVDWPADGTSDQDVALGKLKALLAKLKEADDG